MITFEVAFTPAFHSEENEPKVYVLIDVLRATSAIVSMFARGARSVVLAASDVSMHEAQKAMRDAVLCAENSDGSIALNADISPSLTALRTAGINNRNVVLRSTNGTVAACRVVGRLGTGLIGALINGTAVMRVAIELALKTNAPISLVCSGREAATVCCLDDVYCAGFLTNEGLRILSSSGRVARLRDSSKIALCLFEKYSTPVDALESSESADVLRKIGCDEDILIAASPNAIDIVPVFKATGRTGLVEVSNASDFSAKIPSRSGRNVQ